MFRTKGHTNKKSEDVKKSAGKVLDTKKDTPTRAKHLRLFLDNSDLGDIIQFFDSYYSHIYFIVYDSFVNAEQNLRQKGAHKAQREELESVLYLLEKVLIFLPEALSQRWQYHSIGRLMSKLLHPGNSWKLLKREAMRLFLLWYSALGEQAGDQVHAIFATLVPGFPSPYPNMGLTALAALTPEPGDGPVSAAPILPLIPPQSAERWKSQDTDLIRIFLDVLLELMVSQVILVEWRDEKPLKQKRAFNFLFEKFKTFYMPAIFPDFNWHMSLYKPSLELPEVRKFRPNFVDTGDGTKKMDPMLACRVVVIKWVAQYTHITRGGQSGTLSESDQNTSAVLNITSSSPAIHDKDTSLANSSHHSEDFSKANLEGQLVREVLYGTRHNVNFVHEVYRQSFLLSFSHSPAMKRVITVYKDWIQMNVQELPPFLLEPNYIDRNEDSYYKGDDVDGAHSARGRADSYINALHRDQMNVRAGLQNVLQLFVTNAANVFLLEVSPEYPILLEEQVEMCKRVLNIYRYMVMNVKMDGRTWEQLLFILLQITQLTLTESPPRRREDTLGGRLAQAIFQTLIVTWIKANLYVVVSCELWDQFLEVLSSLTLWEELIREWFKTMETLTRVLARQVYNLDLNDLPLDRLSEQKAKKRRGKTGAPAPKINTSAINMEEKKEEGVTNGHPAFRNGGVPGSPYPSRNRISSTSDSGGGMDHQQDRRESKMRKLPYMRQRSNSEGMITFTRYQEEEMLEAAAWRLSMRKSRSVDSLQSSRFDRDQGSSSRSPSPAPSSSMESHSIKDSPVLLDHDTVSEGAYSELGEFSGGREGPRSVMAGGMVKGWLPDVAVVLWRRMLGSLGDVNAIADTVIHAQIYKYLIELHDIMVKIRANQGVSLDNLNTPPPPQFVPPFTIFAPWCFRALMLPDTYQRGRMYALRLLCLLTVRQQDTPLPRTHLVQFYKVLHMGLTSGDPDTLYNLVRFTGSRFFSLTLPGYSAFLFDYLAASNSIISSQELKGVPRTEAVSIAGSLLAYPSMLPSLNLLLPSPDQLNLVSSKDLQDQVIAVLLKAGKKEPAGLARCIALSSLGIFVYRELVHETYHPKLKEAITVLLAALKFNNKAVAQVASDMLMLLSEQVEKLLIYHPDLPRKIVEVLSRSLSCLLPRPDTDSQITAEDRRLLLSLLGCLGEWCMKLPLMALTQVQEDGRSLLHHVFEALLTGVKTSANKTPAHSSSPVTNMQDFDPDIHVDNLKGEVWTSSPVKMKSRSASRELLDGVSLPLFHDDGPGSVVQLAARTIMSHLVNHLNHFPQAIGAASLSSQVSEHDDVPTIVSEELNMDTFQSPNIQLFVLNNTTLLSLVEVPGMDQVGGIANFTTATSQVRVILRDISGKFSWDASILYSPPGTTDRPFTPSWAGVSTPTPQQITSPPRHTTRHRPPSELPTHETSAQDLDQLDDLLQYLGHTSPELLSIPGNPLNSVAPWFGVDKGVESDIISSVISQRNLDVDHLTRQSYQPHRSMARPAIPPEIHNNHNHQPFQHARIFFQQLGLSSWEKRPHIHLVNKNEQLVRELRNLDGQKGRETHKIAVIYVAEGQEDKISILSNTSGSEAFEEFVAGLGWEVELETHTGFMGGLTRNRTTGETAPYYATSFVEMMFHVSTRMPSMSEESMLQKTRHLGNDEIHIVWTEHWRDYRRGILPTEFCDVLIVIYPLKNNLYRIQVTRKPEVPFFGPLYNEMIVDHGVLPGLVRATAVNASRAKRAMMSHYQTYYEERAKALDSIIEKFKQPTTFEEFVGSVYSPSQLGTIIQGSTMRSAGHSTASVSNSNHSRSDMSAVLLDGMGPSTGNTAGWDEGRPRAHTEHELRTRITSTGDLETGGHQPLGRTVTALPGDTHNSHPALRSRVSVVGPGPGFANMAHQNLTVTGAPAGGHFTQITLSDEDSGSSSDKLGPYKTTTNINSAPRRPLATRQDSGSGSTEGAPTRKR
eukprot:GFUD01012300.1.p1 GENE.GFUD01012300.1~~GFUD01012300.1.p1  ORF type:complete len:1967 (-),score=283.48 GFUD01012300.1:286-6186(-)